MGPQYLWAHQFNNTLISVESLLGASLLWPCLAKVTEICYTLCISDWELLTVTQHFLPHRFTSDRQLCSAKSCVPVTNRTIFKIMHYGCWVIHCRCHPLSVDQACLWVPEISHNSRFSWLSSHVRINVLCWNHFSHEFVRLLIVSGIKWTFCCQSRLLFWMAWI